MRKTIVALVALFPLSTFAADIGAPTLLASRSVKSVCAAGTTCTPLATATAGMSLDDIATVDVVVCADSGKYISDGSGLDVYFYDHLTGLWAKSDLLLTVPTGSSVRCGYARGDSPGKGIPILGERGRIQVVPTAMAVDAGALTVYLLGTDSEGNDR